MGMKYLALAVVLAGGCGRQVGPSAEDTSAAMRVAWDDSMAMEMSAAPVVVWLDASTCDHVLVDEPQGTLSDLDNCVEGTYDSRGWIQVVWRGSFSGSLFAKELSGYKTWITEHSDVDDWATINNANHALIAAGM